MLSATGGFSAILCARLIKEHTRAVRQCVLMIVNICILLQYSGISVEEIFKNLSLSSNYCLLLFIKEINKRLGALIEYEKAYNDVISEKTFTKYLDSEDCDFMRGFLSMLGKSDLSGQLMNCKMYSEFFKGKLNSLEKSENNKCKSAVALVMGVTLTAIILIL